MTIEFSLFANRDAWAFDCPEGAWTGRLDQKAWGKSQNLILYFTEEATGRKFWFSVFSRNGYRAREGGPSFNADAEPGDVFELITATTKKNGNPNLKAARKLNG